MICRAVIICIHLYIQAEVRERERVTESFRTRVWRPLASRGRRRHERDEAASSAEGRRVDKEREVAL